MKNLIGVLGRLTGLVGIVSSSVIAAPYETNPNDVALNSMKPATNETHGIIESPYNQALNIVTQMRAERIKAREEKAEMETGEKAEYVAYESLVKKALTLPNVADDRFSEVPENRDVVFHRKKYFSRECGTSYFTNMDRGLFDACTYEYDAIPTGHVLPQIESTIGKHQLDGKAPKGEMLEQVQLVDGSAAEISLIEGEAVHIFYINDRVYQFGEKQINENPGILSERQAYLESCFRWPASECYEETKESLRNLR